MVVLYKYGMFVIVDIGMFVLNVYVIKFIILSIEW